VFQRLIKALWVWNNVRVVIGDRIVLFGDKMIMNEPKGFYKGHFPWLQRTLRVLVIEPLKKGSVLNLLGVPNT